MEWVVVWEAVSQVVSANLTIELTICRSSDEYQDTVAETWVETTEDMVVVTREEVVEDIRRCQSCSCYESMPNELTLCPYVASGFAIPV